MVEGVTNTTEDKGRFLLELYRKALTLPEKELYEYFLDHAVQVTGSKIGFFHRVTDDQKTIILTTWNEESLKTCTANYENHYPIEKAGNWADCVRVKRPVIYNNFALSPNQKGLPEGHTEIKRILSVPIIEDDKVQVIFGVGNKTDPYTQEDVVHLDLVANELNKIMKQRRAERELRESKEKYHSLFANMTEGFFLGQVIVDKEGKPVNFVFLEVNNGFEKQSGLRALEIIGKSVKQALPGIEQSWIETYGKVALIGNPVRFENYNQNTKRWYEVYAYCPVKGQFAAMFTDVTKRKETEAALRESRIRWATTLSSIGDAVIATDTLGKVTFMNVVAENLTGWSLNEARQKPVNRVFRIVNEITREVLDDPVREVIKKGIIVGLANHTVLIRKDGFEVPIDDSAAPIKTKNNRFMGAVLVFRDITDRRKTEKALMESEEMLKRSEEISHLGSWELDLNQNKLIWSDEVYRIFGLAPQEFAATYEAFLESVHPDDRAAVDSAYSGSIREGRDSYEIEHRVVRKNTGEVRIVYEKCRHFRDSLGRVIRSIGMVQDITERKKMEAVLRESEIKFRTAANFTYDWEYWIAPDGNLVYMSPSCKKATGYTSDEFIKDPELLTKIVHAQDKSFFNSHFELTSEDGSHEIDFRILTKEGDLRWVSHVCQPVLDDNGKFLGRRVSNRDITERKKMLSQLENYGHNLEKLVEKRTRELRVKERMAAIGQTAAMVGHDLRNPLQSVTGEVYLAKKELEMLPESEQKHNLKESIELIEQQASYMDKIVIDLQSFVKPIAVSKQSVNLKQLVSTTLSQIQIPANISTRISVADILKADADPQLLKRVLINLLTNAVQAMHEGGKLTVSAQADDRGVSITVSDTGTGIPEAIKTKIFTPLFTNKAKGQGFGLASSKRIVEAQGGSISFVSEVGKGAEFTIHLP